MKLQRAKCPKCGCTLPLLVGKYRISGIKGFNCPSCDTRLAYKSGMGMTSSLVGLMGFGVGQTILKLAEDDLTAIILMSVSGAFILIFPFLERMDVVDE